MRKAAGQNEDVLVSYLHACVIEGDEGGEQIQVACGKHYSKQDLALSGDSFNRNMKQIHYLIYFMRLSHLHI